MSWLRVYEHEISRRRNLKTRNPDLYGRIWMTNPKGLLREEECDSHVWVPATHLMIHDSAATKIVLGGVKVRAFREAHPWTDDQCRIFPQMCWKCEATRELELPIMSSAEIRAEQVSQRSKKERKKKYTIEFDYDDFMSDVKV